MLWLRLVVIEVHSPVTRKYGAVKAFAVKAFANGVATASIR